MHQTAICRLTCKRRAASIGNFNSPGNPPCGELQRLSIRRPRCAWPAAAIVGGCYRICRSITFPWPVGPDGAAALREILRLYDFTGSNSTSQQIDGLFFGKIKPRDRPHSRGAHPRILSGLDVEVTF